MLLTSFRSLMRKWTGAFSKNREHFPIDMEQFRIVSMILKLPKIFRIRNSKIRQESRISVSGKLLQSRRRFPIRSGKWKDALDQSRQLFLSSAESAEFRRIRKTWCLRLFKIEATNNWWALSSYRPRSYWKFLVIYSFLKQVNIRLILSTLYFISVVKNGHLDHFPPNQH